MIVGCRTNGTTFDSKPRWSCAGRRIAHQELVDDLGGLHAGAQAADSGERSTVIRVSVAARRRHRDRADPHAGDISARPVPLIKIVLPAVIRGSAGGGAPDTTSLILGDLSGTT